MARVARVTTASRVLSSSPQAEKFGDSFVFEGLLSEQVKAGIQQAVSTECPRVSGTALAPAAQ